MPDASPKLLINLDLLKPQGEPQKLAIRLLRWLLSAGRFIIVFVEIIVLAAFFIRFKLDNDIANTKEAIEGHIPYIESLKPAETLIRRTQFQLSTIKNIRQNLPDYNSILKNIADQTPIGVILQSVDMEKVPGKVNLKIIGVAQNDRELATFVFGLKQNQSFSEINLVSVSLEQGLISFTITGLSTGSTTASTGESKL